MNSTEVETLADVMLGDGGLTDEAFTRLAGKDGLSQVRLRLKTLPVQSFWPLAQKTVERGLKDVLDVSLADVLGTAWNKYRDVQKHLHPKQARSGESVLVHMAEHSLSSTHRPRLEILVDDKEVGHIEFTVELRMTFDMATLEIREGAIREIRLGSCSGTGTLTCGSAVLLVRKLGEIHFPGVITFDPKGRRRRRRGRRSTDRSVDIREAIERRM